MGVYSAVDVFGIIAAASNIKIGNNPSYTKDDFLEMYPQFGAKNEDGTAVIPAAVITTWIKFAHASLSYARYGDAWRIVMGLFIAHFLTLYMQTAASADDPVKKVINAGLAKGLQSSKSAGDLSVSYDFGTVTSDFDGWGTYKLTAFGQQFITLAKAYTLGGMTVW